MKSIHLILIFSLFFCISSFSQKVIKHNISKGETILGLAIKYGVSKKEIYELNPKTKGALLQLNQEIRIPNKKNKEKEKPSKKDKKEVVAEKNKKKEIIPVVKEKPEVCNDEPVAATITHVVQSKETLYSLSKQFGLSMEAICELNPELKTNNLKKGLKLKFPNKDAVNLKLEDTNSNLDKAGSTNDDIVSITNVVHKVVAKETLYGISKQYGVSIADIEKLNPGIENGLPVDYLLMIKKGVHKSSEETKDFINNLPIEDVEIKDVPSVNVIKADYLIRKASEHLGTRYRSGGTTSAGFDCSGLMFSTFQNVDMTLPRSSQEMANYGVRISRSQAQKGDLIFFATFGGRRVSHVGMVTEVVDGVIKFIHSSTGSGVIVSSLNEAYYARTYVQINRVLTE
jgi:LysM repeat protein